MGVNGLFWGLWGGAKNPGSLQTQARGISGRARADAPLLILARVASVWVGWVLVEWDFWWRFSALAAVFLSEIFDCRGCFFALARAV